MIVTILRTCIFTFALLFIFINCSQSPQRKISSGVEFNQSLPPVELDLSLFGGPRQPARFQIAKSLSELPLQVIIKVASEVDPNTVKCFLDNEEISSFDDKTQSYKTLIPAKPNGQEPATVSCSLTPYDAASLLPVQRKIKVQYHVLTDTFIAPSSWLTQRDTLLDQIEAISAENFSFQFTSEIKNLYPSNEITIESKNFLPQKINLNSTNPHYLEILQVTSLTKIKKFFGLTSKDVPKSGLKVKKSHQLIYPEYQHGAILCGLLNSEKNKLEQILMAGENLLSIENAKNDIFCHINHYKNQKSLNKFRGSYKLTIKEFSHENVSRALTSFLKNENLEIEIKKEQLFSGQLSNLSETIKLVKNNNISSQKHFDETSQIINKEIFDAKKNEILTNLFPEQSISNEAYHVATEYTLTPKVKYAFRNTDSKPTETLMLEIENTNLVYKTNGPLLEPSISSDRTGLSAFKVTIESSDIYNKQSSYLKTICIGSQDSFIESLKSLEPKNLNDIIASIDTYKADDKLDKCKKSDSRALPITVTFSKTNQYYISYKKESDKFLANDVAVDYQGKIFNRNTSLKLIKNKNDASIHPVFTIGSIEFKDTLDWDKKYLDKKNDLYWIPYSHEDQFIKYDRK